MENADIPVTEGQKLKLFRLSQNLTQSQFAHILGVTQTTIAMIENEQRAVNSTIKYGLLEKFNVVWGTSSFNRITAKGISRATEDTPMIAIPFYSAKAAAGSGSDLPDYPQKDVIYFDTRWLQSVIGRKPEYLSLIKAEGDSMFPEIQNGDLLMVDESIKEIIPNKTFVIRQDNQLRVKRLKTEFNGDVLIISNNPQYPIEIAEKETTIIGQVVWNTSKGNV